MAARNARPISDVSVGDQFIGTVADVGGAESSWININVATFSGKQVNARLRWRGSNLSRCKAVGNLVPVYVHKVNHPAARIEVRMGTPPPPPVELRPEVVRMLDSIQLAEGLDGTVLGVGPYGAVVDVNVFRFGRRGRVLPAHGLLPRNLFKKTWASDADLVVRDDVDRKISVGDNVKVWVYTVHVPNAIILLGSEEVSKDDLLRKRKETVKQFRLRQRRKPPSALQVGEIRYGRVRETAKFGLFVDIGVRTDGLIHYSNMGDEHRWDWKESIPVSTEVNVKVLSVDGNRIDLQLLSVGDESSAEEAISPALLRSVPSGSVAHSDSLSHGRRRREADRTETASVSHEEDEGSVGEDSIDEEEEEDAESEEFERFSDEYFEDKYGF